MILFPDYELQYIKSALFKTSLIMHQMLGSFPNCLGVSCKGFPFLHRKKKKLVFVIHVRVSFSHPTKMLMRESRSMQICL